VCTTAYAAEEFDRIGRPSERIPLGVDLSHFRPGRASASTRDMLASEAEVLVVMASRLSREKRPDLAIEAIRLLRANGVRVRLVCVGTGAIASRMQSLAEGLPVTFLGFVADRDAYATLLASADVAVAPGPIETFGLAALEALASGVPVVVNAASALPEVIGTGGVAAASTPEAFAHAIKAILDRPVAERRAAARASAERFPWSNTVDHLLDLHTLAVS
jgi:alpha-1,6-mannosyltransferase